MHVVEGALLLREQRPQRRLAGGDVEHVPAGAGALARGRADEAARNHVQLELEAVEALDLGVDRRRIDRPQLDHRVGTSALEAPRPDDQAGAVQGQVGRVEEVDLPRLRFDRVEPEARDRGAVTRERHRQLQFDAVQRLGEVEDLLHVLCREDRGGSFGRQSSRPCGGHGCHYLSGFRRPTQRFTPRSGRPERRGAGRDR